MTLLKFGKNLFKGLTVATTAYEIHGIASNRAMGSSSSEEDYRPKFREFLSAPPKNADPLACFTVRQMSRAMEMEQVPMSKEHFEVATKSLEKGDTLCEFLQAENTNVLKSNHSGFVYNAGKLFHQAVFVSSGSTTIEKE